MGYCDQGCAADGGGREMAGLTPKEEEFCRLVVCERLSKADAYRKAFNRNEMSPAAASKAANRLSKKDGILSKMDTLRAGADKRGTMSLERRMELLSSGAEGCYEAGNVKDMVKCIHELNLIEKVYDQAPTVNVAVGVQVVATFDELMHELEGGGAMSRSIQ